jgi:hypothetical protein
MYKVGHKTSPCTATFNDLLCFEGDITTLEAATAESPNPGNGGEDDEDDDLL